MGKSGSCGSRFFFNLKDQIPIPAFTKQEFFLAAVPVDDDGVNFEDHDARRPVNHEQRISHL